MITRRGSLLRLPGVWIARAWLILNNFLKTLMEAPDFKAEDNEFIQIYTQQNKEPNTSKPWKYGAIVSVCAGGGIGIYYLINWIVTG